MTSIPASVHRAIVPAAPKSTSSGCAVMERTLLMSVSSSTPAILTGGVTCDGTVTGPGDRGPSGVSYLSGTRVGVARVRVCFLKKGAPGRTYRQKRKNTTPTSAAATAITKAPPICQWMNGTVHMV